MVRFAQDCKVTEIDGYAFADAIVLKSINIPSSVTTLHYQSFRGSWFTELVIPESVKNIEKSVFAFTECNALENLTIKTKKEGSNVHSDVLIGLYDNGKDGDINLILDDSWFEPDAVNPNRQAKKNADGIGGTWMGQNFKSLKKLSEFSPQP